MLCSELETKFCRLFEEYFVGIDIHDLRTGSLTNSYIVLGITNQILHTRSSYHSAPKNQYFGKGHVAKEM